MGRKLVQALQGMGTVSLHLEQDSKSGLQASMTEFVQSKTLQQEFFSKHPDSFIFSNHTFRRAPKLKTYHSMVYDAVYATALAACQTPGLFTGDQLLDTLSGLELQGASGYVKKFTPGGTTRDPDSVTYRIDNLFVSQAQSDDNFTRFETQLGALVRQGGVQGVGEWLYYGKSTIEPPPLPPLASARL